MEVLIISEKIKRKGGGPGAIALHVFNGIKSCNGVDAVHVTINENKLKSYLLLFKTMTLSNFEVINIHSGNSIPFLVALLPLKIRRKVFLTQHGSVEHENSLRGLKRLLYIYGTKFSLARFTRIIFVSEFLKNKLEGYCNKKSVIKIIYNGIDKGLYASTRKDIGYAFVGSYTWAKGLDSLLDELISQKVIIDLLHIGGGGELKEKIHFLEDQFRSQGGVIGHTGIVSAQEVRRYLLRAKYLLIPSRFDSFNVVLLEALNASCTVLTTVNVGAGELIVHGVNGYKFGTVKDMVLFMKQEIHISTGVKNSDILKNGLSTSESMGWERQILEYLSFFEEYKEGAFR